MLINNHVFCYVDAVDDVDSVEKMIGLLLRESGDRLNEKVRNTELINI